MHVITLRSVNAVKDDEAHLTKAKEVTSQVMKEARRLEGFSRLTITEKDKVRDTLERETRLFYRDLAKLKRQVADQIEEITKKRVMEIALALKDVTEHHPDFKLAELVKLLNDKIIEET